MKKLFLFLLFIYSISYSQIKYEDYFLDKSLRINYSHIGNNDTSNFIFQGLKQDPYWSGNRNSLITPFDYGKYKVELRDKKSGKLIYVNNFATLFSEWQSTDEAKKIFKSFPEAVNIPFPKNEVIFSFYTRDRKNIFHKNFEMEIDPNNYFIEKNLSSPFPIDTVYYSGNYSEKVDIVFIPEGYTEDQMELFLNDCKKFSQYLLAASPYKENKDKFNFWSVKAPSRESGTDIPKDGVWRNTLLNSKFYTFDLDRYLMVEDYQKVKDIAANAPYDQIYILVNSNIYGGGAIYNFYSLCINKNPFEEYVFTHEFGHGFASLADEYYDSETSYNDFYDLSVEPIDPNLTTLVDFNSKWVDKVEKDTPIPTPSTEEYFDKVGAFEGGGYISKGIYRPMQDCSMNSATIDNFCPVCKQAIIQMINYYTK